MSINQTRVVDIITTSLEGSVVLTISDHLVWDASNNHLLILQEKLNAYLSFIESGELLETYPDARGRDVLISIQMKFAPVGDAIEFLNRTKTTLNNAGYGFRYIVSSSVATA